ncbi:MAG: DoxX family protein, partial [Bryobacteraceae bacterium]|nr:DoxX family protein [Bryobacteraceae bacterium]
MRFTFRKFFLVVAAIIYIGAGCMHFLKTSTYLKIMPPFVPWHLAMVYLSGAAEIIGGIGLLIPSVRRWAAWGLVALLIAV